jgi:outer membrane lipoprotein-sorting protein
MSKFVAAAALLFSAVVAQAADVDSTLKSLQDVGQKLRDFSADIRNTTESSGLGNDVSHAGKVFFQRSADGTTRIHVIFDKRISGNSIQPGEKNEYLLDGPTLVDRNYRSKTQTTSDILKPGQKLDLFKIGQGPFPLPVGQDPADVKKAFVVKLVPAGKNDPAASTHLKLTPNPGTSLEKKFNAIDIWVDDASHMPVRVDTENKRGDIASTELSKLALNPPGGLKDADFKLPPIDGSWNVHIDNYHD